MLRSRAAWLALVAACSRCPHLESSDPAPAPSAPASSSDGAAAAPRARDAWTAATVLRNPPVPLPDGVSGIVAHTPDGLDPSQPIHLVQNVILIDATYDGATEAYARWLERGVARGRPRKLVAVYGPWGSNVATGRALARRAEALQPGSAIVDPPGALADAVRGHMVTVKAWPHVEHAWMLFLTMSKALSGLGLPPRPVAPPRELAPWTKAVPQAIAFGETRDGTLDDPDARLENGARVDDYTLDLAAGQRATIAVRGQRSFTEPCCALDVVTELRGPDGRVVAADDDSGGGFDARLEATAPAAGAYTVRVSTSGSGDKRGPYELRLTAP